MPKREAVGTTWYEQTKMTTDIVERVIPPDIPTIHQPEYQFDDVPQRRTVYERQGQLQLQDQVRHLHILWPDPGDPQLKPPNANSYRLHHHNPASSYRGSTWPHLKMLRSVLFASSFRLNFKTNYPPPQNMVCHCLFFIWWKISSEYTSNSKSITG